MANQERNTEATDDAIMSSSSDYNLYLPMDIIFDILSRLPVKSLLQIRCVCKTFRYLISNPTFISSHLLHHRTTTIFTFKHRTTSSTTLSLLQSPSSSQNPINLVHPFPNRTRDLHLIGSINGLLCLCLCLCLSLSRTIHPIAIDASSPSSGTPLPNSSNLSPSSALVVGCPGNPCVDVWMLEDPCGGESNWCRKFVIGPVMGVERFWLLQCTKNGEIIAEDARGRIFLYSPQSGETKYIPINGVEFKAFHYVESLVSIKEFKQQKLNNQH